MTTTQLPKRGFLYANTTKNPDLVVEFQFNPAQMTDHRSVNYATLEAPGQVMPTKHYTHGGERTITFKVVVDSSHLPADDKSIARDSKDGSITPELNKYRAFAYPDLGNKGYLTTGPSFLPLYAKLQDFRAPPLCLLSIGQDTVIECVVTDVNISVTLFNAELKPLRAEVSLTLVELPAYGGGQAAPPGGGGGGP